MGHFSTELHMTIAKRDMKLRHTWPNSSYGTRRRHHGQELYLTSFKGMKTDPQEIGRAALAENLGECR